MLLTATIIAAGCGFWGGNRDSESAKPAGDENLTVEIPFSTKEPENFQAEFIITHFSGVTKHERLIRAARNGSKVRYDYPTGLTFLQTGENTRFLMSPSKKVYSKSLSMPPASDESGDELTDFLTSKWLNEKHDARFEDLGLVDGLKRFQVRSTGPGADSIEIIIYFDENLQIPVKQEFYSISEGQKQLRSLMEVRNFKPVADDSVFALPADYTELSPEDFQSRTRGK